MSWNWKRKSKKILFKVDMISDYGQMKNKIFSDTLETLLVIIEYFFKSV